MGMKKLTEGGSDILNKHGKRKEHHALKIPVTSNFPQRSRDIESRRNSTKQRFVALWYCKKVSKYMLLPTTPSPPPPAIKNLLSGKHRITTKAVSSVSCRTTPLEAFRGEGRRETAAFAGYPCSDILVLSEPPLRRNPHSFGNFCLSIIPAYHAIPQRRKNNRNNSRVGQWVTK